MKPLKRTELVQQLKELGINEGDPVMLHSSLRSLGTVEGGALFNHRQARRRFIARFMAFS
jgi:aminoglycoside N3'-acetyltransferase